MAGCATAALHMLKRCARSDQIQFQHGTAKSTNAQNAAYLKMSTQTRDYYKVLGVTRNADQETIKKAFRKLAREHHPDANKGDKRSEERFKELNEANEVLSDPEKRKLYDRLGANYKSYTQGGGPPPGSGGGSNWSPFGTGGRGRAANPDDFDFSELFGGMFNGGGAGPGGADTRKPRDFEQAVEITVEEAYHGTTRVLQKSGQPDIEVQIPRGARSGTRVRVKGQGGRNARGQAGDLYLAIDVKQHPVYEIKGDDLYREFTLSALIAMLGGDVTLETLAGNLVVRVPAGTSSNRMIRLRGRGMPKLNAPADSGDMYLRVALSVPADLTPDEREQIAAIARSRGL
jgi:curved DNA-binding protein